MSTVDSPKMNSQKKEKNNPDGIKSTISQKKNMAVLRLTLPVTYAPLLRTELCTLFRLPLIEGNAENNALISP